jgi:hypothetical protein
MLYIMLNLAVTHSQAKNCDSLVEAEKKDQFLSTLPRNAKMTQYATFRISAVAIYPEHGIGCVPSEFTETLRTSHLHCDKAQDAV